MNLKTFYLDDYFPLFKMLERDAFSAQDVHMGFLCSKFGFFSALIMLWVKIITLKPVLGKP
jgi:hypothetical protein